MTEARKLAAILGVERRGSAKPVLLMWSDTGAAGVFITLLLYQFDRGK